MSQVPPFTGLASWAPLYAGPTPDRPSSGPVPSYLGTWTSRTSAPPGGSQDTYPQKSFDSCGGAGGGLARSSWSRDPTRPMRPTRPLRSKEEDEELSTPYSGLSGLSGSGSLAYTHPDCRVTEADCSPAEHTPTPCQVHSWLALLFPIGHPPALSYSGWIVGVLERGYTTTWIQLRPSNQCPQGGGCVSSKPRPHDPTSVETQAPLSADLAPQGHTFYVPARPGLPYPLGSGSARGSWSSGGLGAAPD